MGLLLLIALFVGVYFAITIPLNWLFDWIFRENVENEKSQEQKELEDFINGKD